MPSKGIIYCGLKPSKTLLDENGCTKVFVVQIFYFVSTSVSLLLLDMSLTSSVSYVLQLCDFGLARKLKDITKTPFCRKVLPTIVLFMLATYLASMSLLFGLQNSLFLSQNCTTTLSTHSFSLLMHLFGCHTRKVPPFTTWLLE